MSYEKELFDEVIYVAAGKLSPNDAADLLEWVESLEVAKRKADEYEAKAKAWDLLKLKLDGKNKSILSNPKASDEDLDFVGNNTAVLWEMSDLEMKFKREYESGESDV